MNESNKPPRLNLTTLRGSVSAVLMLPLSLLRVGEGFQVTLACFRSVCVHMQHVNVSDSTRPQAHGTSQRVTYNWATGTWNKSACHIQLGHRHMEQVSVSHTTRPQAHGTWQRVTYNWATGTWNKSACHIQLGQKHMQHVSVSHTAGPQAHGTCRQVTYN